MPRAKSARRSDAGKERMRERHAVGIPRREHGTTGSKRMYINHFSDKCIVVYDCKQSFPILYSFPNK